MRVVHSFSTYKTKDLLTIQELKQFSRQRNKSFSSIVIRALEEYKNSRSISTLTTDEEENANRVIKDLERRGKWT